MASLLKRRKPAATPDPVVLDKPGGGKGRATPKRKEAIAARPVSPYMKGAVRKDRKGRTVPERSARGGTLQAQRAAMRGDGDVSLLPPRDRGPEKGLTRAVVDGRRNLTTLLFFVYVLFFLSTVAGPTVGRVVFPAVLVVFVIVMGDAFLLGRRVQAAVAEAYPESRVKVKFYAFQRSLLPRRFRMPRPGVGVPRR